MYDPSTLLILVFLFGLGAVLAWIVPGRIPTRSGGKTDLHAFQNIAQNAPLSVWMECDGGVCWANALARKNFMKSTSNFRGIAGFHRVGEKDHSGGGTFYELDGTDDTAKVTYSILSQGAGATTVFYAQDESQLAETENELKRFVQTLSATFAHLPIGLAVFDKKRDLTLFNPALSYLLGVAPDWLAKRPSMRAFLDRLRNEGAIPEPKDFTTLRQEFANLESGAFTGMYEVDWALPSGAFYRVTGRPHPQGGAALLFEDVTKSSALKAGFRSELRQWHTAFEALSDAVAIFNQAGELSFANDAFDELWDCSLSTTVAPANVNDVSQFLQRKTRPTPIWGELRNFVHDLTERSPWTAHATLLTGQEIELVFSPIADGRVLCEFKQYNIVTLPNLMAK